MSPIRFRSSSWCLNISVKQTVSLAEDEKEVKSEIFAFAQAASVELKQLAEQVAVKKLWLASRKRMGSRSGTAGSHPEEEGLPKEAEVDLKNHWKAVRGFVLPDSWLLSAQLQRKMWNAANASTPAVETLLMQSLRLLSQRSWASGTLVKVMQCWPLPLM